MIRPTSIQDAAGLLDVLSDQSVRRLHGVPDSGLAAILSLVARQEAADIVLMPREDLAVAASIGSILGGAPAMAFMKDAGLFASGNALLSLGLASGILPPLLVGVPGDGLRHHEVVSRRVRGLLEIIGYVIVGSRELGSGRSLPGSSHLPSGPWAVLWTP